MKIYICTPYLYQRLERETEGGGGGGGGGGGENEKGLKHLSKKENYSALLA